mmetsp:Transcript_19568/g.50150  ORF Transcript_19568/g.50150 Transcript_19568/m.50150 type:complete len:224 (+) Transcript_19568:270-941(+)
MLEVFTRTAPSTPAPVQSAMSMPFLPSSLDRVKVASFFSPPFPSPPPSSFLLFTALITTSAVAPPAFPSVSIPFFATTRTCSGPYRSVAAQTILSRSVASLTRIRAVATARTRARALSPVLPHSLRFVFSLHMLFQHPLKSPTLKIFERVFLFPSLFFRVRGEVIFKQAFPLHQLKQATLSDIFLYLLGLLQCFIEGIDEVHCKNRSSCSFPHPPLLHFSSFH